MVAVQHDISRGVDPPSDRRFGYDNGKGEWRRRRRAFGTWLARGGAALVAAMSLWRLSDLTVPPVDFPPTVVADAPLAAADAPLATKAEVLHAEEVARLKRQFEVERERWEAKILAAKAEAEKAAKAEVEAAKAKAEAAKAAPPPPSQTGFPPGCHWTCYLGRYDDLAAKFETEDAAEAHYVARGAAEGRDCRCLRDATRARLEREVPSFRSEPSTKGLCGNENVTGDFDCRPGLCDEHERDVDEKLLASALGRNASSGGEGGGCRMLWFGGIHETIPGDHRTERYAKLYAAALGSALLNAPDALDPILMVGRYGTSMENSTEHGPLGRWATAWGATVVYSPRLSFRDHPAFAKKNAGNHAANQGIFLRMEVPRIVEERGLLNRPGVCEDHVLYTDLDVLFSNPITPEDARTLARLTGDGVAMYGRQFPKKAGISNTGVLVMNVARFRDELPKMLDHIGNWGTEKYPKLAEKNWHDQGIINSYQGLDNTTRAKFRQLPMHYNWKPYWRLEPSSFEQVKIVHFHGPKPNKYLEVIATCDKSGFIRNTDNASSVRKEYMGIFDRIVCCDRGRTADWALQTFNVISRAMTLRL